MSQKAPWYTRMGYVVPVTDSSGPEEHTPLEDLVFIENLINEKKSSQ